MCTRLRGSGFRAALVALGVTVLVLAACGGDSSPKTISAPSPWDLVALGGSMATGYGVEPKEAYTRVYAALLAEEQGVRVRVLDHSSNDPRPLAVWIDLLASDASLRSHLAKAEIVTIFDGTHNIGVALTGGCRGDWPKLKACFEAATAPIPADADRLLAAIRKLVSEQAIILWGYDGGAVPAGWWDAYSDEPYWPEMSPRPGRPQAVTRSPAITQREPRPSSLSTLPLRNAPSRPPRSNAATLTS